MKRILLLLVLLFPTYGAQAQLTLDACREMARTHYPEIRQYDLVRQTAEYTLSNARRAWLPQLSFSAQATWQTAAPNFPEQMTVLYQQMGMDMEGLRKDQYKAALELNQTLWDGGKTRADVRIAEAEAAQSQRSADVDMYALQGRVDELFFGILLLDENIAQIRLTQALLESNLDRVRAMLRNGVATQSDADAVEAQLLTLNQQFSQAEASRESFRRMLGVFIGRGLGVEELVRPDAVVPALCTSQRPELALLDAGADLLTARESLVRSASRPHFGIFAQGYYGYPGLNMFEDMQRFRFSWNALVGVKMQWNFGAYYTKRNSLKQIQTAKQQVEVQRDIFLFNNKLQAVQEDGEIVRLRKALADDDRIVSLRRSVREAAEAKLWGGVIDTTDLLSKITDEATAATARSAREIELLKAIYELKHTINQ